MGGTPYERTADRHHDVGAPQSAGAHQPCRVRAADARARPRPHLPAGGGALGPTEPALDGSEIALTRMAIDRELPMLCICRGHQALNVARGGTLVQDLPDHRQTEPGHIPTHRVRIEPGSLLAQSIGATEIE